MRVPVLAAIPLTVLPPRPMTIPPCGYRNGMEKEDMFVIEIGCEVLGLSGMLRD